MIINFYIFYIIYGLVATLCSLVWYFIYRGFENNNNKVISSTSKLLAYRKGVGTLIIIPAFVFALIGFFGVTNNLFYLITVPIVFDSALIIFLFTVYRQRVMELTNEIQKINPAVGSATQFFFGFSSSFRNMLILFLVMVFGVLIVVLLAWFLAKYNLI